MAVVGSVDAGIGRLRRLLLVVVAEPMRVTSVSMCPTLGAGDHSSSTSSQGGGEILRSGTSWCSPSPGAGRWRSSGSWPSGDSRWRSRTACCMSTALPRMSRQSTTRRRLGLLRAGHGAGRSGVRAGRQPGQSIDSRNYGAVRWPPGRTGRLPPLTIRGERDASKVPKRFFEERPINVRLTYLERRGHERHHYARFGTRARPLGASRPADSGASRR